MQGIVPWTPYNATPCPVLVPSHYLEPEESIRRPRSTVQTNTVLTTPSMVVAELGQ